MTEKSPFKFLEIKNLDSLKTIENYLFNGPYQEAIGDLGWKQGSGSQSWKQIINSKIGIVYSAKKDDKIVGIVAGYLSPNIYNLDQMQCFLSLLFVDPEYRQNGIADKLYKLFEKWSKEQKADYIIAGGKLIPGQQFFASEGFKELEVLHIKILKESE